MTCWRQRPRPQRGAARNDRPSGTSALPQPPLEGCRTVHTPWDSGRLGGPALPGQAACGSRAGRLVVPMLVLSAGPPSRGQAAGNCGAQWLLPPLTRFSPGPRHWSNQSLLQCNYLPCVHFLRICCFASSLWLQNSLILFPRETQWVCHFHLGPREVEPLCPGRVLSK